MGDQCIHCGKTIAALFMECSGCNPERKQVRFFKKKEGGKTKP